MRSDWLGDSYDIVKRFSIKELQSIGYSVYVDPMATGDWGPSESQFLKFIGASHIRDARPRMASALLLDPNTGIGARATRDHTSIAKIAGHLGQHEIVFVFDQSFSRGAAPLPQLEGKLLQLEQHGAHGFYYDSHARFLFASLSDQKLFIVRDALLKAGLPDRRLFGLASLTGQGHGL